MSESAPRPLRDHREDQEFVFIYADIPTANRVGDPWLAMNFFRFAVRGCFRHGRQNKDRPAAEPG